MRLWQEDWFSEIIRRIKELHQDSARRHWNQVDCDKMAKSDELQLLDAPAASRLGKPEIETTQQVHAPLHPIQSLPEACTHCPQKLHFTIRPQWHRHKQTWIRKNKHRQLCRLQTMGISLQDQGGNHCKRALPREKNIQEGIHQERWRAERAFLEEANYTEPFLDLCRSRRQHFDETASLQRQACWRDEAKFGGCHHWVHCGFTKENWVHYEGCLCKTRSLTTD